MEALPFFILKCSNYGMVPLIRPIIPDLQKVINLYKESVSVGQLSNYGPIYWKAKARLEMFTGGNVALVKDGTAAIKIALQVSLDRGTRVAIPDFTHIGTLAAVTAAGMKPVILPSNPYTLTLCPDALEKYRNEYDAFIVVSPFGYEVNFLAYDVFAAANDKFVMYDLAGAFGIEARTTNPVTYSFHATKNLSVGEGGCVVFNCDLKAEHARTYGNFCINSRGINYSEYGFNHKMDELHCAYLLALLEEEEKIWARIENKKKTITLYQELLREFLPIQRNTRHLAGAPSLAVVVGVEDKSIVGKLAEMGIIAKFYYPLLSQNEFFEGVEVRGSPDKTLEKCLALPGDVSLGEIEQVVQSLKLIASK